VDLREGVFYQKCYDPECRSFRSACMPLPSHVWEQCRQQHTAEETHVAATAATFAGPAPKLTTAAAVAVQGACVCQQQQQQQQVAIQAGEAAEEEDEQCLQLLQQFEEQQGTAADGDAAAAATGAAVWHSGMLREQAAEAIDDADEYAQCLQLLQEVEGNAGWAADTG
jgi:hypothetical protein